MTPFQRLERWLAGLGTLCQIIGATVLFVLLGHYLIGGGILLRSFLASGQAGKVDARFAAPVYDEVPYRIAYWTEFERAWGEHFEPYYHWRRNGFDGEYINVQSDGVRLTTGATPLPDAKKIFMFGGSTMWGTGAPDDKTIPSIVQSLLGGRYRVLNYGETAYVSAQELNYLLYQLSLGNIPDVVVFYDGVNDGYAGAYSPAVPRDPHNLRLDAEKHTILRLFDHSNYKLLLDYATSMANEKNLASYAEWDRKVASTVDENSSRVVDMYEAHIQQVKGLARAYGFEAFFFWQPNLFSLSRKHMNSFERNEIETASPALMSSQRRIYQIAKERFSGREAEGIFFLGDVFNDVAEPIYIDWHHVGPNGNEIVAKEMLERLRGAL